MNDRLLQWIETQRKEEKERKALRAKTKSYKAWSLEHGKLFPMYYYNESRRRRYKPPSRVAQLAIHKKKIHRV